MKLKEIAAYWDTRAEGYSLGNMAQLNSQEKDDWRKVLLRHAPKKTTLRCLDIGCGPGILSIIAAEQGHEVTSIDYSDQMLARAKENGEALGLCLHLRRMDAQNLDFPDEAFDYIFCRDLTWNLEQPLQAYKEWLRVLCPGGRLLILDSNHYLHYYDEEYRTEHDLRKENSHPYMLGVDATPIDRIAEDLPLSREHRPAWDMEQLFSLGASRVCAEVKRRTYTAPASGEEKSLIGSFTIWAEKF